MATPVAVSEVLSVIEEVVRPGTSIDARTPLLSSGLVDSFAVAELAAALEARFGVALPIELLGSDVADTADQLAALVASRR